MASGWTNRGKYLRDKLFFHNTQPVTTNYYVALVTSATAPNADTNTFSQLTEVAAGNGYTSGGIALSRNSTDFDVLTEDDTNDRSQIQLKNIVWTASGGTLPASGSGARYAVLLTDEATVANRQVICWWDLTSDRIVSDGQTLTLVDAEMRTT